MLCRRRAGVVAQYGGQAAYGLARAVSVEGAGFGVPGHHRPEQAPARRVEVILHRSPPPRQVLADGHPAAAWSYDTQAGETSIWLIFPTQQGFEIEVGYAGSA